MQLDTKEIQVGIDKLSEAGSHLAHNQLLGRQSVGTTFSQVSGLDQSGAMHGSIRSESEPEATKGLANHFANTVHLLAAQLMGYRMADTSFGDVLGSVGRTVMGASYQAIIDDVHIEPPVVNAFTATAPVANRPASLEALNAQLQATDIASMEAISADWNTTASTIEEALSYIPAAIGDLSGSAETESIARAIDHLQQVEAAGSQYKSNAQALSQHTANLATVAEANALQAAAALSTVRSIVDPVLAKAVENQFLRAFSPKLTTELVPVTPVFTQLLPELGSPDGAGTDASGELANPAPAFENTPLPKIVQQALTNAGYRDLAYASTPAQVVEQFGRPNPDMLESIAAGATPTQAASTLAPSLPPALPGATGMGNAATAGLSGVGAGLGAPGIGPVGAMGTSAAGGGGAGHTGAGVNGLGAVGGAGAGRSGAGAGGGRAPLGAMSGAGNARSGANLGSGAAGVGRSGAGAAGSPVRNGVTAAGPLGAVGGRGGVAGGIGGVSGAGGSSAVGSGSGGAGGMARGLAGAPGGVGGAVPGQAVGHSAVAGVQSGNGQNGARGMMAAGPGAYGAGQRGAASAKRGKIQAVTSSVEREGNLKALLGEAPEVVPGVIGAWVREPRHGSL